MPLFRYGYIAFGGVGAGFYYERIADYNTVSGYVPVNERIWGYHYIFTDLNLPTTVELAPIQTLFPMTGAPFRGPRFS